MQEEGAIADQILEVVRAHPDCTLDEVTEWMQEAKWAEVFVEVDRLSRLGRLRLSQSNSGFITTLHAL